ncbi:hypothetical protein ACEQPO_05405 [Bacillus sp. SL00103]
MIESLLQYESDVAIAVIEDLHHEEIVTSHLTNLSYDFYCASRPSVERKKPFR